jgi:transcriptional regulator with XRE-family HTH domain
MTQSELALRANVRQYAISRLLGDRTKTLTPDIKKILDYARIGIDDGIASLIADARVRRALSAAWDGTESGTALLCRMIEALGPVVREAALVPQRAAARTSEARSRGSGPTRGRRPG